MFQFGTKLIPLSLTTTGLLSTSPWQTRQRFSIKSVSQSKTKRTNAHVWKFSGSHFLNGNISMALCIK